MPIAEHIAHSETIFIEELHEKEHTPLASLIQAAASQVNSVKESFEKKNDFLQEH